MRQAHRDTQVKFECQLCSTSTTFGRHDNLKLHLRRIHGVHPTRVVTKLECDLCGSSYATKPSLINHMKKAHIDLSARQPFQCSLCFKTFIMKYSLIDHLDAIHLKKFCCRICCGILGSRKTLKNHESRGNCQAN